MIPTGRSYLEGLLKLHTLSSAEEQEATFRSSFATLASLAFERPAPLEGIAAEELALSLRVALKLGLLDNLDWLSAPSAGAALYELAAALPPSAERRFLGRHILSLLYEGNAATFATLATRLCLSSSKSLHGVGIAARVALCIEMPTSLGTRADALALALISRPEFERDWLSRPSMGSLPARRLSARVLENAAKEAVRKANQGDRGALTVFELPTVSQAYQRLLRDRESLVWRHAASARGILSSVVPALEEEIERDLDPNQTPTEWRRASTSLCARLSYAPEAVLARARSLLASSIVKQDPGVLATALYGIGAAVDVEAGIADDLFAEFLKQGGLDAIEAFVEVKHERWQLEFGKEAVEIARNRLRQIGTTTSLQDDGKAALIRILDSELTPMAEREIVGLHEKTLRALSLYATQGPKAAHAQSKLIVEEAQAITRVLCEVSENSSQLRRTSFRLIRELDMAIFERPSLQYLLSLDARPQMEAQETDGFAFVCDKLTQWFITTEGVAPIEGRGADHFTVHLRQLRSWLHLLDTDVEADDERRAATHRCLGSARVLLQRMEQSAPSALSRALCASFARACDALIRQEVFEISDVLLIAGNHLRQSQDWVTLAEASMIPELEFAVRSYRGLAERSAEVSDSSSWRTLIENLHALGTGLPCSQSPRTDALRRLLIDLSQCFEELYRVSNLPALKKENSILAFEALERSGQMLAQMSVGAELRFGIKTSSNIPSLGHAIRQLTLAVVQNPLDTQDALTDALANAKSIVESELPPALARVFALIFDRLGTLSADGAPRSLPPLRVTSESREAPLPEWLPPGRVLGGFYVERALGTGGGGSVFLVKRAEQRTQGSAQRYALKVPEFTGTVARALSETEFMQMFRDEAGALLALPAHPNLARFVTFDADAQPKPILVMELIEGPSLARMVDAGTLDSHAALTILDGIAQGLEAMHRLGIGHLDIKPSNIILRQAQNDASNRWTSVLVDFGLAGRKLRPGCATSSYGAPEVWNSSTAGLRPSPLGVDVYAFACLAFETLTQQTLFEGENDFAVVRQHLIHEGYPPKLKAMGQAAALSSLARVLASGLRANPKQRASIMALRMELKELESQLNKLPWPLPVG